jgi:hypothetical protein
MILSSNLEERLVQPEGKDQSRKSYIPVISAMPPGARPEVPSLHEKIAVLPTFAKAAIGLDVRVAYLLWCNVGFDQPDVGPCKFVIQCVGNIKPDQRAVVITHHVSSVQVTQAIVEGMLGIAVLQRGGRYHQRKDHAADHDFSPLPISVPATAFSNLEKRLDQPQGWH